MKPGYKTSEFWISLFIIVVLIGLGVYAILRNPQISSFMYSGGLMLIAWFKAHSYEVNRVRQKMVEEHVMERLGKTFPWLKDHFPDLCGSSTPPPPPTPAPTPTPSPTDTCEDNCEKGHSVTTTIKVTPKTTQTTIITK